MSSVEVKQFRTPAAARSETFLSYCLYDSASREAWIVDPLLETLSEYSEFLNQNRLKLSLIVETQSHFSHPTAAHALSRQFHAPVAMSEKTESAIAERKLRSEETLALGNSKITVLLTPGVRPDSLCLYSSGMALTGETLWAGVAAGFGLPKSDCGILLESLLSLKKTVSPDDLIFPGYDVQGLSFSRWKTELEKNPDLQARNQEELKYLKSGVPVKLSEDFLAYADFNSQKNPTSTQFRKSENFFCTENMKREKSNYSTISADKLSNKMAGKSDAGSQASSEILPSILIDVRDPDEFAQGHIPGAKNIPLSKIASSLSELEKLPRVYLSCLAGKRSALAASTLSYVGVKDVVMLIGGFQAWQSAGLPVKK